MTGRIAVALAVVLGVVLLSGADGRATAIAVGLLVILFGVAGLWSKIIPACLAIWGVGWAVLAGGIAGPHAVVILGAAVAVVGGGVAFITGNYVTWFGAALLGEAVALIALAVHAFGTGGALAGAAMLGVAAGALGLSTSLLLTREQGARH